jgi:excisionase family DNA binding protein
VSTTMEKRVYSLDEVAHYLSCCRATVYNLINSGDLKSLHIGSRRGVLREDLEAFIEARIEKPPVMGVDNLK